MAQKQILKTIGHSPTLNTVLMVEKTLKKTGEQITLAELKRKLPKQIMHQTLTTILDYLQMSRKILIGTKGIIWIYEPNPKLWELMTKGKKI
ncbi:MAG: hypothetical protein V1914_01450 [archaeon]